MERRHYGKAAVFFVASVVLGSLGLRAAQGPSSDGPRVLQEHRQTGGAGIVIKVLSSRNDVVSGGDALIDIFSQTADTAGLAIKLNGADVTKSFQHHTGVNQVRGLVDGLKNGENILEVSPPRGDAARLVVTNWPLTGPIISGPHEKPFVCMTQDFELPGVGGKLGPSRDADCSADTRVDYVYYTQDGAFKPLPKDGAVPADAAEAGETAQTRVPFIVRIETGVINRGIYQIAMLHDPKAPAVTPYARPAGWNGALLYQFGGGCEGGMYIQGKSTAGVLEPDVLSRGFAMASSSLNVYANNCDDLLASETMMMVKERFIETFGPPAQTIGWGCSGGSYQAEQIGDNYPGLVDGIVVGCSFPDVGHAAVVAHSFGPRLFWSYYTKLTHVKWTEGQIGAASGMPNFLSLKTAATRGDRIDPRSVCPRIAKDLLYDLETNPAGARCSIYDHAANSFGRDPKTGFARRPLDNVGVQYGLSALNAGAISKEQFLDLNTLIGGVDIDAKHTAARTVGDPIALRRAYQSGRFLSTGGGLAQIPMIDYRAYVDLKNGDNHQRVHSFSTRARFMAANGNLDNHVMLTESDKYGLFSLKSPHVVEALEQMHRWLTNISADTSAASAREKVKKARPADLVDACFAADDKKIVEQQVYKGDTACNRLYPSHANPYIAAGEPVSNDVVKCVLKPVDPKDYAVTFTAAEMQTLRSVFPEGVCDYAKKGVEQQPLMGTWLSFGPA